MSQEVTFPRDLYTKGGDLKLYSKGIEYPYSTAHVENVDEYKAAIKNGYVDDFAYVMSEEDAVIEVVTEDENSFDDDDF